jgi:starch-binding outer membrane protein, SusD/RagB family
MTTRSNGRPRSRRRQPVRAILGLSLLTVIGCDNLLDVTIPGQLQDSDLNDPALAETLVLSAQGAFECAFSGLGWALGMYTGDFYSSSNRRTNQILANRLSNVTQMDVETGCLDKQPPPVLLPMQTARLLAEDAITRIESFPAGTVDNPDLLIARANAYAGYAYQLLGEAFCDNALAFDESSLVTRADAFRAAESRFTSALEHASRVASPAGQHVVDWAHVGRARSRLFLDDDAGVLEDARLVTEGFVMETTHAASDPRRWNQIHDENHVGLNISVQPQYRNLNVDGVPDPRVVVTEHGIVGVPDGATPSWRQQKMPDRTSPNPFASWREAQLMIAEIAGGQEAVGIINRLRDTWELPHFASNDPAQIAAQVLEERRRELWLQGNRMGDMIRLGIPFPSGVNNRSEPYGTLTCIPLFIREEVSNPNI